MSNPRKKTPTYFSLSDEAIKKVNEVSRELGISKGSVLEASIRLFHKQVLLSDLPPLERNGYADRVS